MTDHKILYLSQADVASIGLGMTEIIQLLEKAFNEKGQGRIEMPPKPGIHPTKDAFIHAMPAYVSKMGAAGVKWVSGFPGNPKRGLPYVLGLLILNDPQTGVPICVMDCTWITAKRTGAATALAAKHLAKPNAAVLGVLGCGVQGRSNLEALTVVCKNLEEVRAYDVDQRKLDAYVNEMADQHGLKIVPAESSRRAVEECDIVVTAGPILRHPRPVIEASWFKNGGFACPLDFDSYWKNEVLLGIDKFCVDDIPQIMRFQSEGRLQVMPEIYADLGEIVAGKKPGRENDRERTMSMNLGLALVDVGVAIRVYHQALEKGVIDTIIERACSELESSASISESCSMPGLAGELRCLLKPLRNGQNRS